MNLPMTKLSFLDFLTKSNIFDYDSEKNMLIINLPKSFKLGINNPFDIIINGDFDIETTGEVNLLSHGSNINIDSLNAKIYLNSLRCKQIPKTEEYENQRFQQIEESKKIKELPSKNNNEDLYEIISMLQNRLEKLEFLLNYKFNGIDYERENDSIS